jgi:hypothetical protein
LLGPRAPYVAQETAVPSGALALTRCGIEVDPFAWHEQGGKGVEQRRFARSGATDEEETALGNRNLMHTRKGAPVIDLKPGDAKLR